MRELCGRTKAVSRRPRRSMAGPKRCSGRLANPARTLWRSAQTPDRSCRRGTAGAESAPRGIQEPSTRNPLAPLLACHGSVDANPPRSGIYPTPPHLIDNLLRGITTFRKSSNLDGWPEAAETVQGRRESTLPPAPKKRRVTNALLAIMAQQLIVVKRGSESGGNHPGSLFRSSVSLYRR